MSTQPTLESHFEGKEPRVGSIYNRLLGALREFGPVIEAPKKTSIHLDNANGFAGVYTRQGYILLHFRTDHKIEHPRMTKTEQLSSRRFKYTLRLESESDVDDQLLEWLKSAYELAG